MENKKPFYLRVGFYLGTIAFLFVLIALSLYAGNCKSEFNGEKVSVAVVAWDSVTLVMLVIVVLGEVGESLLDPDTLIGKICSYLRLAAYVAIIGTLVAFLMQILDEYSLLGTVLYPIFSGTVGDPVDNTLSASYFTSLVFTFVSLIVIAVQAALGAFFAYRKTNKKKEVTR